MTGRLPPFAIIGVGADEHPSAGIVDDHLVEVAVLGAKYQGGVWDETIYSSLVRFRNAEEAESLNTSHYRRTCSWLHKHTILDEASSVHVGRFLCPPPVLFFEEGDIQLDINW